MIRTGIEEVTTEIISALVSEITACFEALSEGEALGYGHVCKLFCSGESIAGAGSDRDVLRPVDLQGVNLNTVLVGGHFHLERGRIT